MSQYISKGDINNEKGGLHRRLMALFDEKYKVYNSTKLEQLLFYFFKLCDNGNVIFDKATIEDALSKCKNDKCKEILNQYIAEKDLK